MKTPFVFISAVLIASTASFAQTPAPHPWLEKRLAEQRVKCPPGNSPVRGPAGAQVTIVEFGDFECPYCAQQEPILKKVLAAYPTQVRLVFKHLPLEEHPKAKEKAVLAECVGIVNQGRFWQAHDEQYAGAPPNKVTAGLNQGELKACLAKGGAGQVDNDLALAKSLGLAMTPSFVVDGIRIGGTINFDQFKLLIDSELARKAAKPAAN